jgi:hypothetical protein
MSSSDPRRAGPTGYALHPLTALDGVLLYVTLGGEHVGTYFGATEAAAAASAASALAPSDGAIA